MGLMTDLKGRTGNKIEWGKGHIKYIKNNEQAKNFAYGKAFYFTTFLNGELVNRKF